MPSKHRASGAITPQKSGPAKRASGGARASNNVRAGKRWDQGFGVREDDRGEYVPWLRMASARGHLLAAEAAGHRCRVELQRDGVIRVRPES